MSGRDTVQLGRQRADTRRHSRPCPGSDSWLFLRRQQRRPTDVFPHPNIRGPQYMRIGPHYVSGADKSFRGTCAVRLSRAAGGIEVSRGRVTECVANKLNSPQGPTGRALVMLRRTHGISISR